jgi:hypothetical protein
VSLWTFWPRRHLRTDIRSLRVAYLSSDPSFTRLHVLDTQIGVSEDVEQVLGGEALRLKIAMALLAVAVLLASLGTAVD